MHARFRRITVYPVHLKKCYAEIANVNGFLMGSSIKHRFSECEIESVSSFRLFDVIQRWLLVRIPFPCRVEFGARVHVGRVRNHVHVPRYRTIISIDLRQRTRTLRFEVRDDESFDLTSSRSFRNFAPRSTIDQSRCRTDSANETRRATTRSRNVRSRRNSKRSKHR